MKNVLETGAEPSNILTCLVRRPNDLYRSMPEAHNLQKPVF